LYAASWGAFGAWCVDTHRLIANPFTRLANANVEADPRRPRRALNEADLVTLLDAARRRPLAEYGRESVDLDPDPKRPKRSCWTYAPITPDNLSGCEARARDRLRKHPERIAEAQAVGLLRALTYKTAVLTGLRSNELHSLTVGAVELDGPEPVAHLAAEHDKSRRGAEILIRHDLAADLHEHLAGRLRHVQRASQDEGQPIPMRLPPDAPLLSIPPNWLPTLGRDLVAAGLARAVRQRNRKGVDGWRIDKADERGKYFDRHAFRTTFNSLLAEAGVPLALRRAMMRHAAESVTDKHYLKLLDLRGQLDKLPLLPLDPIQPEAEVLAATGTDDAAKVCTRVYRMLDNSCISGGTADKTDRNACSAKNAVSADVDNSKASLASAVTKRVSGLEPPTFNLEDGAVYRATMPRPLPDMSVARSSRTCGRIRPPG